MYLITYAPFASNLASPFPFCCPVSRRCVYIYLCFSSVHRESFWYHFMRSEMKARKKEKKESSKRDLDFERLV